MDIQVGYFPQVLVLVVARLAAVIGTVPFFGGTSVPRKFRAAMVLVVSIAILPFVSSEWVAAAREVRTGYQMLVAILGEVLLGAGIGLVCHMFIGICQVGGMIAGRGSSLMMAQSLDPVGGSTNPIMSQMLQMIFILLVLLSNGHLILLKMTAMSFRTLPSSMAWINGEFAEILLVQGRTMFDWGLRLAMPILCMSLLLNAGMGLMARMAPDFNVLFLSLPIRLFVGISVFGLLIKLSGGFMQKVMDQMLMSCGRLLGG